MHAKPAPDGRSFHPRRSLFLFLAVLPLLFGSLYAGSASLMGTFRSSSSTVPSAWRLNALRFHSEALDREMPMKVFLPPGYDSSKQRYPVLYMLHGRAPEGDENYEWEVYGIFDAAQAMMRSGEIAPFIIVLPQGERSYWVDHADGPAWGLYLARDIVAEVDRRYRTLSGSSNRAVGGLSMGADGALQIAMSYPGVFGIVGMHSPVLKTFDQADSFYGGRDYFEAHYPVSMVERDLATARSLVIELDAGDDDLWLASTEAFHQELTDLHIPHVWNRWPGPHNGDYWSQHLAEYLRFYSQAFKLSPE